MLCSQLCGRLEPLPLPCCCRCSRRHVCARVHLRALCGTAGLKLSLRAHTQPGPVPDNPIPPAPFHLSRCQVRKPSRWYGEDKRKKGGGRGNGRGGSGVRAARRDSTARPTLVVALGTPEPDLRVRLGKRSEREPDSEGTPGKPGSRMPDAGDAPGAAEADAAMRTPPEAGAEAADVAGAPAAVEGAPSAAPGDEPAAKRRATERRGPVLSRLGPRKGQQTAAVAAEAAPAGADPEAMADGEVSAAGVEAAGVSAEGAVVAAGGEVEAAAGGAEPTGTDGADAGMAVEA